MSNANFYRDQAALHQGEADGATLANVRERSQRAADAWTVLAERSQRADAMRIEREGRRPSDGPDAISSYEGAGEDATLQPG